MLSEGSYSGYRWIAVLDIGDSDLDALRKEFMDTHFPTFPEPLPQSYFQDMEIWERCKAYDNAQYEAFFALGYEYSRSKDELFVQWLIKEHGCKSIDITEYNLDDELQSWTAGRVNTYGY